MFNSEKIKRENNLLYIKSEIEDLENQKSNLDYNDLNY
jgi:hypothetical protein